MSIGKQADTADVTVTGIRADTDLPARVDESLRAFWSAALAGAPTLIELPTDRPRPLQQDFASETIAVHLQAALVARLKALSCSRDCDLHGLLLASWAALLGRLSNQHDVVIGSLSATTDAADPSASPLPLRIDLSGEPDVAELLRRTQAQRARGAEHRALPLAQIVDAAKHERSARHAPLFQAMLAWRDASQAEQVASPTRYGLPYGDVQIDLCLDLGLRAIDGNRQSGEEVVGELTYATALFDRDTAEHIVSYFQRLLLAMADIDLSSVAGMRVVDLPILPDDEQTRILDLWNAVVADYPQPLCLHESFEAQVARTPDAIAVVCEGQSLTYRTLNCRANRLARRLRAVGLQPDDLVAICMRRTTTVVESILATLKAGAAYLPMDLVYPTDRLAYMLEDAAPKVVLVDEAGRATMAEVAAVSSAELPPLIDVDAGDVAQNEADSDASSEGDRNLTVAETGVTPDRLAYVIYTSGSTGKPKGVMIEHRHVGRLMDATDADYGFGPNDVWTLFHSYAFDFSVWEIWGALRYGGRVVVVPIEIARSADAFYDLLCAEGVTVLNQTPSAFRALIAAQQRSASTHRLREVIFGGEALELRSLKPWYADARNESVRLVNMYGITETTVHVTFYALAPSDAERENVSPVGVRIDDLSLYVLDEGMRPCPRGVIGELYVGGAGVARGYLNRPELTAERFVEDPFRPGERLYKSGDLARWLADGSLDYIGRNDFQVKIRGFRIELGEIEARLAACESVREAVVLAREDAPGDKQLVAYYESEAALSIEALRGILSERLPAYMIPSAFVWMPEWPLTPNGKLDRRALPAPDGDAYARREYEAPASKTETALAAIWEALLRVGKVGRHDHFFDIGGHSLLAVQMMSRVRQALGVDLMQHGLFDAPVLAQLASRIESAEKSEVSTIETVPRAALMPLSLAQQRMWFLTQIDTTSSAYHICGALRLRGTLDTAAFERAMRTIIARHEALRTRFVLVDGEPMQAIDSNPAFTLGIVDLRDARGGDEAAYAAREHACAGSGAALFAAPFDLRHDLPLRVQLVRLDEESHELQLVIHHIVADGWSMGLIYDEISRLYAGEVEGTAAESLAALLALPIQYVDYAAWQCERLSGERLDTQLAFWRRALAGAPPLLEVPTDHARPTQQDFSGAGVAVRVDTELTAQLKALARKHGATLYMTLLGSWALTLGRLANQDEVVVGSPVAGRQRVEIEALIGFFVNTLAFRVDFSGAPTVAELLARIRQHVLDAQIHQELPFDQVVEAVKPPRNTGHTPIFQVMLALQNQQEAQLRMPGIVATEVISATTSVQCDLLLNVSERDGAIVGTLDYATALFDPATAERFRDCWLRLLRAMVEESERPVSELTMLDDNERQRVLDDWNHTARDYPRDSQVHVVFERQAERTPHATALVGEGFTLDYAELNRRANRIAHGLIAARVRPNDRVAICMERSVEMVIGFLAILKAGAGYVPIDPTYPGERRAYLLADSAPTAILTTEALRDADWLVETGAPILVGYSETGEGRDDNPQVVGLTGRSLAYVIYTSGSTGEPKGVLVEHRNILRLTINNTYAPLTAGDCVAHCSNPAFDASTWEIWGALLNGARLLVVPSDTVLDPQTLNRALIDGGATALWLTVGLFNEYLDTLAPAFAGLNHLLIGGDALDPRKVAQALAAEQRPKRLVNGYGPTETTTFAVTHCVERVAEGARSIPIGRPIAHTRVYLLDPGLQPVPIGVSGELYIGGDGVARGYLNRPDLTAERFLRDPFVAADDARIYKTGDLCRWLADGTIEFLGRNDFQVKIRGFRIELGEIEARLAACEGVREAVVLARSDHGGPRRLVAYCLADGVLDVAALRVSLATSLPDYMLPSAFVRMESWPLTANGKLDRETLPEPEEQAYARREYEAPEGESEILVAATWAELLKLDRVGRHDNFFELGGHSLIAVTMIERIRKRGLQVDIRSLFTAPTLKDFAAGLRRERGDAVETVPANAIPAGAADIAPDMLPLVSLTQAEIDTIVAVVVGGASNIQDIYPLSPLQEGILFHSRSPHHDDIYLITQLIDFPDRGRLDQFLSALEVVVHRHDILRTGFFWSALSEPVQVVHRRVGSACETLTRDPAFATVAAQLAAQFDPARCRLDLSRAPLFRLCTVDDPESSRAVLAIGFHHLVMDHTTLDLVLDEAAAIARGEAAELPPSVPFRNYIWQARINADHHAHNEFFTRMLADIDQPTAPFGLSEMNETAAGLDEHRRDLPAVLCLELRERSRFLGVGPAAMMHLAWAMLLARATGMDRVVFGTVLFGRMDSGQNSDRALGLFINTLPVRIDLAGLGVAEAVKRTQAALAELLHHEHASLAAAQRCSGVPAATPLFTSIFNYRYSGTTGGALDGAIVQDIEGGERTNFPIALSVDDYGDAFGLVAQVMRDVGAERVCDFMQTALEKLLDALRSDPATRVDAIDTLPPTERERILVHWNETARDYPRDLCVHQLFEHQAAQAPKAIALMRGDEALSYAELNARSNCLAHRLIAAGVAPSGRVAICVERSVAMVVAVLAVMKAGAAYLPLDPTYPRERLAYQLGDAQVALLLADGVGRDALGDALRAEDAPPVLAIDDDAAWKDEPSHDPEPRALGLDADAAAYMIYTSGSTGLPKGTLITHRSAVNLACAERDLLVIDPSSRVLQFASFAFDACVWEMFAAFCAGATLVLPAPGLRLFEGGLIPQLRDAAISHATLPPALLSTLPLEDMPSSLRTVVLAGEAPEGGVVERLLDGRRVINAYGPTEATVCATMQDCVPGGNARVIGAPLPNIRVYVLDEQRRPAPIGVVGEIYIGGAGVARGYWNRPELDAERFVRDPFAADAGARLYKTGDLGLWLADGTIEFLGRNDFQVKIRGFRIELGEIEAQLLAYPGVREAVVLAREDRAGANESRTDKRLIAYLIADAGLDNAALRSQLAQALPDYMVPAAFVRLDAFPLTPNGKLDRKALPAPESDAYATRAYEPPQGRAERAIAAIWEELLRIERVGRHDNFFELGGHSLIAVTMIERMRKLGMHGDVRALFTTSSLAGFAATLREAEGPRSAPANAIPDNAQRIEPHMLPLVELHQSQIDAIVAQVDGGAANIQDIYPLAPLQEGILFHRMLAEHGDLYHATVLVRFADRGRIDDFLAMMQQVIDRHDILRTCFVSKGLDTPVQVVLRRAAIAHEALNLDPAEGPIGEQLATRYAPGHFSLDVNRAPLLRFGDAFDPATGQWLMCLVFHHLVLDHTSLEVIMEEATLIGQGRSDELLPPAPFRNYIWQVKVDADPAAHRAFFERMLGDIDRPTTPFGLTQTSNDLVRFDEYTRMLPGDLSATVRRRARELGVSAASLMHLAWAMVLARATGQSSVVFGTVLFGRMSGGEDADRALGLFINTLPIRIDIDDANIVAAIKRTHAALAELLPHEHAPLVDAQRCSAVPPSMPLFTSLINYTYSSASASFRSNFHLEPTAGAERTNYPLAIAIDDQGENFEIAVQVLPAVGASRIWEYLRTALSGILDALDAPANASVSVVSAIEVMPASECAIVDNWNDTACDFPLGRCAHALFSEQVARDPQALALVFGGERIAYGDLNARANRIAHRLRASGIGPGALVAVALERGVEMIAALIGVLKAGGAYVPMATDAPSDRIAFMLDDATPALLLAHRSAQLPECLGVPVLILDELASELAEQSDRDPDLVGMDSSQPAYVIYTSGTTGTPKGVVVSHRNLVNFVYWCREAELIGPGHSMTQFAPYTFDASAGEIFGALLSGAELHLLDDATIQSPPQLQQYLLDHDVRFAALPPAYLQHMDPSRVPEGFRLLTAGSAPTPELVERWAGRGHYLNGYGPTETTILSTSTWLSADEETITIGKPIANTRLYLLDEQRRQVPIGVSGEIWIGGEGVTHGYLNRPELTAERYLDDPFDRRVGARMYRTGDLGRWMEDGAVEFLGRNDFQVKIRGFRIELGEIENRLCAFERVREAVVMAREDGRGEKQLVAYYLADATCDAAALRHYISQTLPEYMMPAAFVLMRVWPLTVNGKIDRKALPEPDDASYARRAYAAPENDIERSLSTFWAELLRVDRVGRFDNFFDLGGHSLLAMQLVSRIREALSIELPLRALFEASTLCELAERLSSADSAQSQTIPLLPRGQPLPLSLAQQRLWFLTRIEGASAAYHMGGAIRLRGALDASALSRALQRIVDRHELLRSRFVLIDGQPMLEIAPESRFDVAFSDLRGVGDAEAQAQAAWTSLFERDYDLAVDLPLRGHLLRLSDDEHRLYLTMHHIISDGWSIGVILRELGALYAAEVEGRADPLPPLTVQYADFAAWQRDWLDRGHAERLTAYWAHTLGGAPTLLELPTDRPRPAVQDFAGDLLTLAIDADLTPRLRALSQRHGVTLYMTLIASWAALLCRLSNQDEVVIGTPMAGRNRAEIEPLVGFFVNTVALRINVGEGANVGDLLDRCKQRVLEAQTHQDLPFDRVVEAVRPPRTTAHTPIFQTMLTLNNRQADTLEMPGMEVAQIEVGAKVAQFDISLDLDESECDIVGTLNYATSLFDRTTIQRYAGYWLRLLRAMAESVKWSVTDGQIARLPMLDLAERHRVLTEWNTTVGYRTPDVCLHRLFEERAAAAPQAIAAVCDGAHIRYAELNARANRIAHRLIALGVVPNARVLICLERGIDALAAILAVLKAGGAYVPVDPHLPADRLRYLCEDCQPVAAIATVATVPFLDALPGGSVLVMDREFDSDSIASDGDSETTDPAIPELTPEHSAYVIYTSGSTGQPKGVEIEHRSIVARILHAIEAYDLVSEDVCLQFSALSFDASVMQIFSALGAGASLLMRGEALWAPETIVERIRTHGIAIADIPPSYLQALFEADARHAIPSLRIAIIGGEATLTESIRGRSFDFAIFNEYGPTEATVTATCLAIPAHSQPAFTSKYLPIGRPVADTRVYILDRELQPVPIGVAGELHIAGVGVARGYLNRPDLTNERFIVDPFASSADARAGRARMYKTGDLARWCSNGTIEYLGRNDFQVKLRGFRIELGEIESLLIGYVGVREAAVLVREDVDDQPRLVAYCLTDDELPIASLRDYLAAWLPDYMVPAAFVRMRDWPLTSSGKLNRKILPAPEEGAYAREKYMPPQGASERVIAALWEELLGLERVGRDDHFFDLGGHSLLMLRMIRQLSEKGIALAIQDVYRLGTVAAIAAEIEASKIDPHDWLRARQWNHADGIVDGQRVLWLAPINDQDTFRAFKRILPRCVPSLRPQRIVSAVDPAAARAEASSGCSANQMGTVATADMDRRLDDLSDALRGIESAFAAADIVEALPFAATHRETLQWTTRDGLHVIPLPGWWSSDELRRAFAQAIRDHEMLRLSVDIGAGTLRVLGRLSGDTVDTLAFDAERLAWIDLRGLSAGDADRMLTRIDPLLRAAKARSRLSYAAALITRSDTDHLLALYGDHLTWDGQSFGVIGEAILGALTGAATFAPRPYREFIAACNQTHDPHVLERIAAEFDAPRLAETVRDTTAALAARAVLRPQVIGARIPLVSGAAPAEQAFALFRRFVSRITGLERFGMVLTHHGRQLGERSHFGQIGLFVDKIPILVDTHTTLDAAMRRVGLLHRDGVRYVDWQRSGDARVAGTLPTFFDEISFNYQAAIDSDWEANAVGLHGIFEKMNATRGIICEFYVGENAMEMLLAFRGDQEGVQEVKANIESVSGTMLNVGADPVNGQRAEVSPQPMVPTQPQPGHVEQAIVVENLRKRYSETDVVKGISFSVPRGCCFGILGPNGAGKTSLLGMIEGIVPITSGRITVMGMDVATQIRQIQPQFGVQLQHSNYFQFLTVSELLNFYSELRTAAGGKRKLVPARRLLERLDLADKMKFKVDELSGGQKQRLSIALAMLADPEIVFLDEPTAALDPHSRRYTWEFIEELKQDRNRTIVLTTHYMEEAERLCDEIMIMNQGEVVGEGNPSSLIAELNATQQTRVKLDVGAPGADIAEAISAKYNTTWDEFNDSLLIATDDVVGALREAMAQTEMRHVKVLSIYVERLSLEDVFLNKTGKELKS